MDEKDKKEIEEIFEYHVDVLIEDSKHRMGILSESFQHKLDIVVEGHQVLDGKIDRLQEGQTELTNRVDKLELSSLRLERRQEKLEQGQDNLEKRQGNLEGEVKKLGVELSAKIDSVGADLAAHRADTESHRGAYRVKEGKD